MRHPTAGGRAHDFQFADGPRDTGQVAERRYGRESLFDPLLGNMHVPAKISWLNLSAYWPEIARRPVLGLRSTFLRRYETAGGRTPMVSGRNDPSDRAIHEKLLY
jgi:hypothetical protein